MTIPQIFNDILEKRTHACGWVVTATLLCSLIIFIMFSYPMMRPGIDIWWHLGAIKNPAALDPAVYPWPRLFWHHTWNHLFSWFEVSDVFTKAKIIHRVQFLACFLLVLGASYSSIEAATHGLHFENSTLWTSSLLATVIWFIMTGTHSVAHGGGPGSSITQAWILWYSVNYQISLPFVLLASALTLRIAAIPSTTMRTALSISSVVLCLLFAFLFHMAELVYYFFSLALILVFFVRGVKGVAFAVLLLAVAVVGSFIALKFSYRTPRFMTELTDDSLSEFLTSLINTGQSLRDGETMRVDTGWTILHLFSVMFLAVAGVLSIISWDHSRSWGNRVRAILFLISTSLFSLLLFSNLGAGFFSFITHGAIAYRFAFGSLLFVGIPIGLLNLLRFTREDGWGPLSVIAGVVLVAVFSVLLELLVFHSRPIASFSLSLLRSLDAKASYYGLSNQQLRDIQVLANKMNARSNKTAVCVDISTAYYLYFVVDFKQVALPKALEDLSGFAGAWEECGFPPSAATP